MNENLRDALEWAAGQEPNVDLTEQAWAQGRVVRRRRQATQVFGGVAAAALLVGALWVGGGLLSDPEAVPGPADPPADDVAVSSVEPDPTSEDGVTTDEETTDDATTDEGTTDEATTDEATTDEATTDESTTDEATTEDETTEEETTEDQTTEDETTTEEPVPALPLDPCTTPYPDLELRAEGLPDPTRERAEEVLAAAAVCDLDTLIALAYEDETFLSFGVITPEEAFSGENGTLRAAAIATVMTLFEPGQVGSDAPYRWPVSVESEEEWALLVESGLYTQEEVNMMRDSGMGYTGWRVGVGADGTWMFMTAGD